VQVAVIGAGIAGITAGVLLPIKVPGVQLTIFDKNSDVVRKSRITHFPIF
jgi:protoporphyrinogen oxidase